MKLGSTILREHKSLYKNFKKQIKKYFIKNHSFQTLYVFFKNKNKNKNNDENHM